MGKPVSNLEHAKRDDDLFSYLFIDLGMYQIEKRMCRKMQRDKFKIPNVDWEPLLAVLDAVNAGEMGIVDASYKLRRMGPIAALFRSKRTDAQMKHAEAHLNRYLEMWVPEPGYRICLTHRYEPRKKKRKRIHPVLAAQQKLEAEGKATEAAHGGVMAPTEVNSLPADAMPEMPMAAPVMNRQDSGGSATPQRGFTPPVGSPALDKTPTVPAAPAADSEPSLPPLDLGIKATRDYDVHEFIRLYGSAADITDELDEEMRMDTSQLKADFSVLYNPNKNCFQLFLGPGRFVNHDCNNNVELVRSGRNLTFKVVRPIKEGDEIYSFYGAEYFGKQNHECRCYTCRLNSVGDFYHTRPAEEDDRFFPKSTDPEVRKTRSGQVFDEVQLAMLRQRQLEEEQREQEEQQRKRPRTGRGALNSDLLRKSKAPKSSRAVSPPYTAPAQQRKHFVRQPVTSRKEPTRRSARARQQVASYATDSDLSEAGETLPVRADSPASSALSMLESDEELAPPLTSDLSAKAEDVNLVGHSLEKSSAESNPQDKHERTATAHPCIPVRDATRTFVADAYEGPTSIVEKLRQALPLRMQAGVPAVVQSPVTETDSASGSQVDALDM